jgi:hypothetical protein
MGVPGSAGIRAILPIRPRMDVLRYMRVLRCMDVLRYMRARRYMRVLRCTCVLRYMDVLQCTGRAIGLRLWGLAPSRDLLVASGGGRGGGGGARLRERGGRGALGRRGAGPELLLVLYGPEPNPRVLGCVPLSDTTGSPGYHSLISCPE